MLLFGDSGPVSVTEPTQEPAVPHVEMRAVQQANETNDAHEANDAAPAGAEDEPAPEPAAAPPRPEPVVVVEEQVTQPAEPPPTTQTPPDAPPAPAVEPAPVPEPVTPTPVVPAGEDPVVLGMVRVEARLSRGDLRGAVGDLVELARRHPADRRVQRRLAPLLHQRALMHYGEGAVAHAIRDWQHVLEIDPEDERAKRMLDRAKREQR